MEKYEIESVEIKLLLDAIFERYGYDFKSYARAPIERRLCNFMEDSGFNYISEMIPKLMYDESFFAKLVSAFSILVSDMFRDPHFYRSVRDNILPFLKTYPFFKIWHAGCAGGEEVYSMAIILREAGLYDRATIYATDFNNTALKKAKEGIYNIEKVKQYTSNYQDAGGIYSFSDYYHAQYEAIIMDPSLKKNITFASHNLAMDQVFSEMHMIFCRNVLIYFDKDLQNRVLKLFIDSLIHGGFLCLGTKERIQFSDISDQFRIIDDKFSIYQKKTEIL